MRTINNNTEGLEEVCELNRLFLSFLHRNPPGTAARLGVPAGAAQALQAAGEETLSALAAFPQAMFRLELDHLAEPACAEPARSTLDPAHQALQLTLLVSVWNLARQSDYAARFFLGLSDAELALLRALPLSDLPRASLGTDLVRCAFTAADGWWPKLLTETASESRRRLLLIGLQPRHAPPGLAA
jgi:hypothetical protein